MATAINPVIWFEIPVVDLDRAKAFYEAVFGYTLTTSDMGPLLMAMFPMNENATQGAAGSLVKGDGYVPARTGTVIYFSVQDIPATLERVAAGGGKELLPKTSIGQYGFIGRFEDTEGNVVALHSMA
ncbi:VOC family protein [Geobacter sp. AOG1]|uniref:VOC family protein n=1 Tax=Geobacter sp. AOG1 TaxID=1566346 RepID=UPI001CC610A7|nr:VOC family protein [Geobacter sp. AOG1]GFE57123.1 glyoxalase [Geobacter sp. AOG1]